MYKYNIYVGMFDKDSKQQELSNTEFLNTVRKVMRFFKIDYYTIYKSKGHYKHTDNTIVCEPTIIIEICSLEDFTNSQFIDHLKYKLKLKLNQESVLITKQSIEVL